MSLNPTLRFSNRANYYAKFRPSYPQALVKIVAKELGFMSDDVVADIGSGTGLLAKIFLKNGNRVLAVEPNDEMRRHAEASLSRFRNFVSVKGTAEATTLPPRSIDLITTGQALHWFDPVRSRKEFSRISNPGAGLCVVYNKRKSSASFSRAYERIIRKYGRDRAKIPDISNKLVSRYFDHSRFAKFKVQNEQILDFEALLGRLISASYMPTPGDRGFLTFEKAVRDSFDSHSVRGQVRIFYDTEILVGKVTQSP